MTKTRFAPVKQPDGTSCYSGPNCKRHGAYNRSQTFWTPADLSHKLESELTTRDSSSVNKQKLETKALNFWFTIDPDERDFLKFYQEDGANFVSTYFKKLHNRKNKNDDNRDFINIMVDDTTKQIAERTIKGLDNIFNNRPKYNDQPSTYYRALSVNNSYDVFENYSVAKTFTNKGYITASSDPADIIAFAKAHNGNIVVQEIVTRRNTLPLYHSTLSSQFSSEKKELFPRDFRVQVIDTLTDVKYSHDDTEYNLPVIQMVELEN